jgi:hypothetical protein
MKKMNLFAMALLATLTLTTGCALDPIKMKMTDRDLQAYVDEYARPVPSERYKVAVRSGYVKHATDGSQDKFMALSTKDALKKNFSNLGWFDTVDRENGFAIAEESARKGDDAPVAAADFILQAESNVMYIAKQGWKRTAYANKSRGAIVTTKFQLIDLETAEPLIVKTFCNDEECGKGGVREAIQKIAYRNSKKFAQAVAVRLLPNVKVLETRGNGQVALVSMGENYQLEPGTQVEFFYNTKYESDVPGEAATIDATVFARGTVLSVEKKRAWVEVEDYADAGVKKGHSARISASELMDEMIDLE